MKEKYRKLPLRGHNFTVNFWKLIAIHNGLIWGLIMKNNWNYDSFTPVYQKSWLHDLQFLRLRAWQTEIGNFRSFLPFYPSKNQKHARDIIILQMCTKNHDHMMYSSWDMEWVMFRTIFCPFTPPPAPSPPLTTWKKTTIELLSFYTCTKNHNHIIMYVQWCIQNLSDASIPFGHPN